MRNILKKGLFAVILLIAVVSIGCSDDSSSASDVVAENTIQFTYDGTDYVFQKRDTDSPYLGIPTGEIYSSETYIYAALEAKSDYTTADTRILIRFLGSATGDQSSNTPRIKINADAVSYEYATSATINITTYGAVGEWIEGEFSGTSADGKAITDGEFKVIRIADQ